MQLKRKIQFIFGIVLFAVICSIPLSKYVATQNSTKTIFNSESPLIAPGHESTIQTFYGKNAPRSYDTTSKDLIKEQRKVYQISQPKKTDFQFKEDIKVVPGGQSIGVQLQTLGVLVVGHHLVNGQNGLVSPGEEAEVKVGDVILEIDHDEIEQIEDVKPLVDQAGSLNKPLQIKIKRGEKIFETNLSPIKDERDDKYRLGLYIRDSAAGIGTISFYEPHSKRYGALGHIISDMDTKKPIEINKGSIVRSQITAIEKGNGGTPGEKQARFSLNDHHIGSITKNTPFGIFGKLNASIVNEKYDKPMPIALSDEVKEGPAKILTVVEGEKVEEFSIEIVNNIPQKSPETKGMVIKVTDQNLLDRTGGIVQGMSGSPIIQNGKIIGAVTHVFVNDPTSGYGVHIEWMLQDAGINIFKQTKAKAS